MNFKDLSYALGRACGALGLSQAALTVLLDAAGSATDYRPGDSGAAYATVNRLRVVIQWGVQVEAGRPATHGGALVLVAWATTPADGIVSRGDTTLPARSNWLALTLPGA